MKSLRTLALVRVVIAAAILLAPVPGCAASGAGAGPEGGRRPPATSRLAPAAAAGNGTRPACAPGSWAGDTGACWACPAHAECRGGADPPRAAAGYWSSEADRGVVLRCPIPAQCLGGAGPSPLGNGTCAGDFYGQTCRSCTRGVFGAAYRITSRGGCEHCKVPSWLCFIFFVFVFPFAGSLWFCFNTCFRDVAPGFCKGKHWHSVDVDDAIETEETPPRFGEWFQVNLGNIQLMCVLFFSFGLSWPAWAFLVVEFPFGWLSEPATAASCAGIPHTVFWWIKSIILLLPTVPLATMPCCTEHTAGSSTAYSIGSSSVVRSATLVCGVFYVPALQTALQSFFCTHREGFPRTLDADPAEFCSGGAWVVRVVVASITILMYVIVIPTLFLSSSFHRPTYEEVREKVMYHDSYSAKYLEDLFYEGALNSYFRRYRKTRATAESWSLSQHHEIVTVARRALVVLIGLPLARIRPWVGAFTCAALMAVFLIHHVKSRPFFYNVTNVGELRNMAGQLVVLCACGIVDLLGQAEHAVTEAICVAAFSLFIIIVVCTGARVILARKRFEKAHSDVFERARTHGLDKSCRLAMCFPAGNHSLNSPYCDFVVNPVHSGWPTMPQADNPSRPQSGIAEVHVAFQESAPPSLRSSATSDT
jgi:hypothetical protein